MKKLTYAVEQRLRFIDFLVAHYGFINRSAIADYFGISTAAASHDIGEYTTLAPNNIVYDLHSKCYRRADDFKRVWE